MGNRMDSKRYLLGILAVLAFTSLASAENTTLTYYCPRVACTGADFQIWADYRYNDTEIPGATVEMDAFPLVYAIPTHRYESYFSQGSPTTWEATITATSTNSSHENMTANCSIEITDCFNYTVRIWQQEETRIIQNNSYYAVTVRNYNKQLNNPYINDFAWIIAKNNDKNDTALYKYCNVPFGSGQGLTSLFNMGNWIGHKGTEAITNLTRPYIGCESYWFRAKYQDGEAVLSLPYTGNYSIYLTDGTINWENNVAPPQITKSNLFLFLGDETFLTKQAQSDEFWVSHAELDFWGSMLSGIYPIIITVIPIFLFIGLIMMGVPVRFSLGLILLWIILWTVIRMSV
jgi:hypothetical protein